MTETTPPTILQRDHRTLRGTIAYLSHKPDRYLQQRGREYFHMDVHSDGKRTITAHCEIDDRPSVMRDITYSVDEQGSLSRREFAERRALPLLWNLQDALLNLQLAKNPDGRFTADISMDSRATRDLGLGIAVLGGAAGTAGQLGQVARPQEIQQFDLAQMQ